MDDNHSSKRHKRRTVLSKLATSREHQLESARDLERQDLNSSYNATRLKNLRIDPGTPFDSSGREDGGSQMHGFDRPVAGKGEKRSRRSNIDDSSDSDQESRSHNGTKRHSLSQLADSDEDEMTNSSSFKASASQHRLMKNQGLNSNYSNNAMETDSDVMASSVDNVQQQFHSSSYSFHNSIGRSNANDDDEEERDFVPELNRNYSLMNCTNLHPITANSADFKARSEWPNYGIDTESPIPCGSERSCSSSSVMSVITTEKARQRSFLVGSMSASCSLLGCESLERVFPERKMRIFVGTWNMCEMKLVPVSVDDFLLPESSEFAQDAYVIGTQETASNRHEWELKLQDTLGPDYVMFHSSLYGTLHLAIFLRRDLIWFCSVSEEESITTRPGPSSIKTKGAVAVCFTFFGTSFLFINSHFTAHDGRSNERAEDFRKIISGLSLPKIVNCKTYNVSGDDVSSRFECVFWMGDLNCRLEKDRTHLESVIASLRPDIVVTKREMDIKAELLKPCKAISYEELLQHDELKRLINEELAFKNFQEGRIKFLPTYKYDIGTDNFDTSKKNRIPSYTDRILFRSRQKNAISCMFYQSASTIRDSDHKPVFGLYQVSIRPGMDNIPLSGGQFNREVWIEGNKQRASKMTRQNPSSKSSSSVCSLM